MGIVSNGYEGWWVAGCERRKGASGPGFAPIACPMSPGISTRLLATQSDERLLALVRDGHERAFEALVNRYRRPLLNYCRRLSLPEARAEDVLQQALLKTWIALRGGAEVRDIKAWLYRVVHNTAVNAVRDSAHDGERLVDPTLRAGAGQADLERGLALREALAEVAALPRLQREVIVRTAVGGDSHERVASDLGITDGAVRGLLYRARATLRTATTALTPVSWITWLVGRAEQGTPASERLSELVAGGGTAGFGGLLLKGGIAAITAGTLLTGAAVVHLQGEHPRHHHGPHELAAAPAQVAVATTSDSTVSAPALATRSRTIHISARRNKQGSGIGPAGPRVDAALGAHGTARTAPVRRLTGSVPRSTAPAASAPVGSTQGATTQQSTGSTQAGGSAQGEAGAGQSGASGASQSEPVGSAAGSSSEVTPSGSAGGSVPAPPAGESSGGSDPSGNSEDSGTQSEAGGSESSSGSGQSGGVVGTVVHEVGSLLEHLLH
jgi:RNA polymerase sigma factor (sigma-70 family)